MSVEQGMSKSAFTPQDSTGPFKSRGSCYLRQGCQTLRLTPDSWWWHAEASRQSERVLKSHTPIHDHEIFWYILEISANVFRSWKLHDSQLPTCKGASGIEEKKLEESYSVLIRELLELARLSVACPPTLLGANTFDCNAQKAKQAAGSMWSATIRIDALMHLVHLSLDKLDRPCDLICLGVISQEPVLL